MHLIVGLGNPGREYERTRHNAGFRVLDALHERWSFPPYETRFDGEFSKGRLGSEDVLLLKPKTFMNLSGGSVLAAASFYKAAPENVWVVHDDLDLPLGTLRVRKDGSSGGHNGVQDVISRLGTNAFVRFRVGIDRPKGKIPAEEYVLQPFTKEEEEIVEGAVGRTAEAIERALREGLERAMNFYSA